MRATILDLRYRMKSVLAALDRGEQVTVLRRGAEKAAVTDQSGARENPGPQRSGVWYVESREDAPGRPVAGSYPKLEALRRKPEWVIR